jgi:hypothetical protein
MNVVSIASRLPDHAAVRDAFAQATYAGEIPRDRWIEAQNMVARYDDATDDAVRAAVAHQMLDLAVVDTMPMPPIAGMRAVG